jgi:hypothetical protein
MDNLVKVFIGNLLIYGNVFLKDTTLRFVLSYFKHGTNPIPGFGAKFQRAMFFGL